MLVVEAIANIRRASRECGSGGSISDPRPPEPIDFHRERGRRSIGKVFRKPLVHLRECVAPNGTCFAPKAVPIVVLPSSTK